MRKLALALFFVSFLYSTVPAGIITPDLEAKLSSSSASELVPVMITMMQQSDVDLMQTMTSGLNKQATRETVVEYLQDIAESSQKDIRVYLESLRNSGMVSHVYPLFIVNMISLKATPEVIHHLETFSGIATINYEPESFALAGEITSVGPVAGGSDETEEITWGLTDIHAPEVWQLGYNGSGVIVGMIDTGVNYNHLDLADHMWDGGVQYPNHGWNFYNNNSTTLDGYGHGTHTAGTVASDGTAGSQCGVAPNATIMILKVLGDNGQGSPAQCMAGMNFAVANGADLFSMSLGWYGNLITPPDIANFRVACENMLAAGMPGAVAAGNEYQQQGSYPIPNNVRTPGRCPPPWLNPAQTLMGGLSCVICCGATTESHGIASFSSHGPSTWRTYAPWYDYPYSPGMGLLRPDVSAPGVNTKSCSHTNISGYTFMQGTSMATPHIAGAMALMLQKNISLTPREIDSLLEVTALDLGTTGKDNTFGAGLINALSVINATPPGAPSALDVTLTPINPPIQVPAQGGQFNFEASVVNAGPGQPFMVWARIKNPDGSYTTPTLGPVAVNPPVNVALTRTRTQIVPGSWASGTYTYLAYANMTYSYPAIDSSFFTWTKSTIADNGPGEWEAVCSGELFPGEIQLASQQPSNFILRGATPNPFNPTTKISYQLSVLSKVNLKVYDATGRLVVELVNGWREAGQQQVEFDGSGLASGVYLYRLEAGEYTSGGKLILLK